MRNGLLTNAHQRAYSFSNGDGGGRQHRPIKRLSVTTFDSTHSFVSSFCLHASMGTGRQVDARGHDRKSFGDRQVTGVVWPSRHADRLYGECRRPARTW
jgi:hypothetical protein